MSTTPLIYLDASQVRQARSLARRAGAPVVKLAKAHTTVSVERATLRLAGLTGADHEGQPWVNHLVDAREGGEEPHENAGDQDVDVGRPDPGMDLRKGTRQETAPAME